MNHKRNAAIVLVALLIVGAVCIGAGYASLLLAKQVYPGSLQASNMHVPYWALHIGGLATTVIVTGYTALLGLALTVKTLPTALKRCLKA